MGVSVGYLSNLNNPRYSKKVATMLADKLSDPKQLCMVD